MDVEGFSGGHQTSSMPREQARIAALLDIAETPSPDASTGRSAGGDTPGKVSPGTSISSAHKPVQGIEPTKEMAAVRNYQDLTAQNLQTYQEHHLASRQKATTQTRTPSDAATTGASPTSSPEESKTSPLQDYGVEQGYAHGQSHIGPAISGARKNPLPSVVRRAGENWPGRLSQIVVSEPYHHIILRRQRTIIPEFWMCLNDREIHIALRGDGSLWFSKEITQDIKARSNTAIGYSRKTESYKSGQYQYIEPTLLPYEGVSSLLRKAEDCLDIHFPETIIAEKELTYEGECLVISSEKARRMLQEAEVYIFHKHPVLQNYEILSALPSVQQFTGRKEDVVDLFKHQLNSGRCVWISSSELNFDNIEVDATAQMESARYLWYQYGDGNFLKELCARGCGNGGLSDAIEEAVFNAEFPVQVSEATVEDAIWREKRVFMKQNHCATQLGVIESEKISTRDIEFHSWLDQEDEAVQRAWNERDNSIRRGFYQRAVGRQERSRKRDTLGRPITRSVTLMAYIRSSQGKSKHIKPHSILNPLVGHDARLVRAIQKAVEQNNTTTSDTAEGGDDQGAKKRKWFGKGGYPEVLRDNESAKQSDNQEGRGKGKQPEEPSDGEHSTATSNAADCQTMETEGEINYYEEVDDGNLQAETTVRERGNA
ncbi:hypothetical protein B0O99DRAFT_76380 [Bisporella sp. PMI_857]|nr:hypothetical protein B0O99DRAFT_76380 [Bisporella sp. PMI_857]